MYIMEVVDCSLVETFISLTFKANACNEQKSPCLCVVAWGNSHTTTEALPSHTNHPGCDDRLDIYIYWVRIREDILLLTRGTKKDILITRPLWHTLLFPHLHRSPTFITTSSLQPLANCDSQVTHIFSTPTIKYWCILLLAIVFHHVLSLLMSCHTFFLFSFELVPFPYFCHVT